MTSLLPIAIDRPLPMAVGLAAIVAIAIDVAWTTFAVSAGRGPITDAFARCVWRAVRGSTRHRLLQVAGYAVLMGIVLTWVAGMWAGWALVFNADDLSIVDSAGEPGSVLAKIAYAAGALTGAGAGYTAASDGWQLANNVAAIAGLALVTLALTYLFQVVTATTQKRATAVHMHGLGDTPASIVALGAGQPGLGPVGDQITALASALALTSRQHLALPVLHYLHVPSRTASIELAVARLDEALNIADCVLEGDHAAVVRPARAVVGHYISTTDPPTADHGAPPAPDISSLPEDEVDPAGAERLRERLDELTDRRRRLRRLIEDNGWEWERDVLGEG